MLRGGEMKLDSMRYGSDAQMGEPTAIGGDGGSR
jgi:hypothetical protein